MAAVLFVAGTLICMVSMMRPERLTPLVLRVANKELNADVAADRVELGLRATFPFLTLRVDGLTVVSRDMRALPAGLRAGLPEYADTLLTLRSLRGGLNLASLAKGEIALSDIVLDGAGVNIVTAADGTANYNIAPAGEDTDTTSTELPALSLTRFDIRGPRPARYYDATAAGAPDSIIVVLKPASLAAGKEPMYTLSFGGNLHMPALGQYHLPELPFAFDGGLRWDPKDPSRLRLDNLSAAAAFLSSRFSADIEFAPVLTLRELDFVLDPVRIDTLLACLPDSMRQSMPMLKAFSSDAAIGLGVKLTQPFNTLTDSIPYADVRLDMEPCSVNLGRSRMHDVEARVTLHLRGNDPAATIVDIERLHTAGPATELTLKGTVSDIGDDPYFDGTLTGYSDLSRLPDALLNLVQGSHARGTRLAAGLRAVLAVGRHHAGGVRAQRQSEIRHKRIAEDSHGRAGRQPAAGKHNDGLAELSRPRHKRALHRLQPWRGRVKQEDEQGHDGNHAYGRRTEDGVAARAEHIGQHCRGGPRAGRPCDDATLQRRGAQAPIRA